MTKLPEYDEFKAPWEKEGQEFEPEKGKKFLYSLLQQIQTLEGKVATVTKDADDKQAKLDEIGRAGETEADKIKRENEELRQKLADGNKVSAEVENLRLRVALEKGLTLTQAKRLVGTTEDEIKADADDLVKSFGSNGKTDEDEGDKPPVRTSRRVGTPGDPDPDQGGGASVEEMLAKVPRL